MLTGEGGHIGYVILPHRENIKERGRNMELSLAALTYHANEIRPLFLRDRKLDITLLRLGSLLEGDIHISQYVHDRTEALLLDAVVLMKSPLRGAARVFPLEGDMIYLIWSEPPYTTPLGDGHEEYHPGREVRVISSKERARLFREENNEYEVIEDTTSPILAHWLDWLTDVPRPT